VALGVNSHGVPDVWFGPNTEQAEPTTTVENVAGPSIISGGPNRMDSPGSQMLGVISDSAELVVDELMVSLARVVSVASPGTADIDGSPAVGIAVPV